MSNYPITALATLLLVMLLFILALNVGRARSRYGVEAPATTGNPMFERIYRVQMNSLENAVIFLPALWIFASFVSDRGAGAIALVWLLGRILYAKHYQADPKKRGPGFGICMLAFAVALLGGAYGVVVALAA